jgi:hypothetical protein
MEHSKIAHTLDIAIWIVIAMPDEFREANSPHLGGSYEVVPHSDLNVGFSFVP